MRLSIVCLLTLMDIYRANPLSMSLPYWVVVLFLFGYLYFYYWFVRTFCICNSDPLLCCLLQCFLSSCCCLFQCSLYCPFHNTEMVTLQVVESWQHNFMACDFWVKLWKAILNPYSIFFKHFCGFGFMVRSFIYLYYFVHHKIAVLT